MSAGWHTDKAGHPDPGAYLPDGIPHWIDTGRGRAADLAATLTVTAQLIDHATHTLGINGVTTTLNERLGTSTLTMRDQLNEVVNDLDKIIAQVLLDVDLDTD